MKKRKISRKGGLFIVKQEACIKHPYLDSAKKMTIGVGHLIKKSELSSGKIVINGKRVRWRAGLSTKQCFHLFEQDVAIFERCINDKINVKLSQCQFDALVSFSFNIGRGAFSSSTLRRKLNNGNYASVPKQLVRWVYSGGKKSKGLKARRLREAELWKRGSSSANL